MSTETFDEIDESELDQLDGVLDESESDTDGERKIAPVVMTAEEEETANEAVRMIAEHNHWTPRGSAAPTPTEHLPPVQASTTRNGRHRWPLTDEHVDYIRAHYGQPGHTISTIAAALRVPPYTVTDCAQRIGISQTRGERKQRVLPQSRSVPMRGSKPPLPTPTPTATLSAPARLGTATVVATLPSGMAVVDTHERDNDTDDEPTPILTTQIAQRIKLRIQEIAGQEAREIAQGVVADVVADEVHKAVQKAVDAELEQAKKTIYQMATRFFSELERALLA